MPTHTAMVEYPNSKEQSTVEITAGKCGDGSLAGIAAHLQRILPEETTIISIDGEAVITAPATPTHTS